MLGLNSSACGPPSQAVMGNILPSDHFTNIDTICPSVLRRRDHLDAPPLAVLPPRFDIDDVRTCVRYIQSNKPWENHAGAPYWRVPESMHRRMRNNPHCATVDSDSSAKMGDMYGGGRRNSSAWRPCKTQRCAGSMKREALFRAVSKREGPGDRPKTRPSVSEPVETT